MTVRQHGTAPKRTICGAAARNGERSTAWIDLRDRERLIASAFNQRSRGTIASRAHSQSCVKNPIQITYDAFTLSGARMPVYRAYVIGLHDRPIGVVQIDCVDDSSAIDSAARLVDRHNVELWQMDRPVARFDARSGEMRRK